MARRNPSKAVYIGTGVAAALGVLYLLMKKDEKSGSSSGKSVEQDVNESGAGASGAGRKITKDTLVAKMQHPTVYTVDGSSYETTPQQAAMLVATREYMWNATHTAVIHRSQVR